VLVGTVALLVVAKLAAEAGNLESLNWRHFAYASAVASLLSIGNYFLRYLRWQIFLAQLGERVRPWPSLLCYMSGFAFTLLPGKVGELMRARYYARLGVSASCVGAGFVMERLLDVAAICFLGLLGLGALVSVTGTLALAAAFLLAFAAVVLPTALRWLDARYPPGLMKQDSLPTEDAAGIKLFVQTTYHHARSLLRQRVVWPGLALGVLAWGLEGVGFWILVGASGSNAYSVVQAASVYSLSLLAGAISFVPGGLGGAEAVMLLSLRQAGLAADAALVITLLCRLATLWLAVILGWLAVATLAFQHNGKADAK
jgi:uncharacterized protein (TIRG00374 family)